MIFINEKYRENLLSYFSCQKVKDRYGRLMVNRFDSIERVTINKKLRLTTKHRSLSLIEEFITISTKKNEKR